MVGPGVTIGRSSGSSPRTGYNLLWNPMMQLLYKDKFSSNLNYHSRLVNFDLFVCLFR